jgi:hypothetical protein
VAATSGWEFTSTAYGTDITAPVWAIDLVLSPGPTPNTRRAVRRCRGIKTPEQEAVYGGVAGEQYDQCCHLGCGDIDTLSLTALDQMSDAAAYATISLAQSTQAINGRLGKGNFNVKREPMPAPLELTPGGWPGPALALTPARTQGGRQPLRRRNPGHGVDFGGRGSCKG